MKMKTWPAGKEGGPAGRAEGGGCWPTAPALLAPPSQRPTRYRPSSDWLITARAVTSWGPVALMGRSEGEERQWQEGIEGAVLACPGWSGEHTKFIEFSSFNRTKGLNLLSRGNGTKVPSPSKCSHHKVHLLVWRRELFTCVKGLQWINWYWLDEYHCAAAVLTHFQCPHPLLTYNIFSYSPSI